MARAHGLKQGDRVWVYQTGWGTDLGTGLTEDDPAFRCLAPKEFGGAGGVGVMQFVVGSDFKATAPVSSCESVPSTP